MMIAILPTLLAILCVFIHASDARHLRFPRGAASVRVNPSDNAPQRSCFTNAECLKIGLPILRPHSQRATTLSPRASVPFLTAECSSMISTVTLTAGSYTLTLSGGHGGGTNGGGLGAINTATLNTSSIATTLSYVVGCVGGTGSNGGGGGGGTFVYIDGATEPLLVAGGGGGVSAAGDQASNGGTDLSGAANAGDGVRNGYGGKGGGGFTGAAGGAGYKSVGGDGSQSQAVGGSQSPKYGGTFKGGKGFAGAPGGFGGGGGGFFGGGGGGGYTGGQGGADTGAGAYGPGNGGGSYLGASGNGVSLTSNSILVGRQGNGQLVITQNV